MKLRNYQQECVDAIFSYFENGGEGNPLVAMPTGTGKSPIIGGFIQQAYLRFPNTRFMKLTHVKELIEQNYNNLLKLWPTAPAGVYSSGLGRWDSTLPVTFAGIQTVARNLEEFRHIDLLLIDEAHLVSPKDDTSYQKTIYFLREINPKLKVIGFTATDYRLGQGRLTEGDGIFTDVCFDKTKLDDFNWFIDQGYLVPLVPKRTKEEIDVSQVKIHAGEFAQGALQLAVDKDEITKRVLEEALTLAHDRKHWLVFASGIDHAVNINEMLETMGISSTVVHSKMSDTQRDYNISAFKAGTYQVMVNNGILTTGFDYPGIDCIVMIRPTNSPGLWVQMLGRGTRPVYPVWTNQETQEGRLNGIKCSEKQNCLVLDFAGNTRRLGPINDPVIPQRRGSKGGGVVPIKVCEACGTYNHTAVRFCTSCGAEFPREIKFGAGASTAPLLRESTADVPKVEYFTVNKVIYTKREKPDRPDSMRVSYICGLRKFDEWVCLSHVGYPKKKARDWWRLMLKDKAAPVAESTEEAMLRLQELQAPTRIRVWINNPKGNMEVLGHEF